MNWSAIDNHSLAGRVLRAPLRLLLPAGGDEDKARPGQGIKMDRGQFGTRLLARHLWAQQTEALARFVTLERNVYSMALSRGFI